jgi:hypothetical protein
VNVRQLTRRQPRVKTCNGVSRQSPAPSKEWLAPVRSLFRIAWYSRQASCGHPISHVLRPRRMEAIMSLISATSIGSFCAHFDDTLVASLSSDAQIALGADCTRRPLPPSSACALNAGSSRTATIKAVSAPVVQADQRATVARQHDARWPRGR